MRLLMGNQQGPNGEALNLRPRFLLGGIGYETVFSVLRAAVSADRDESSTGIISTLTDQRLNATTAWFGVADPAISDAVQLVLREGDTSPLRFERKRGTIGTDGPVFLVGCDCQVLAVDHRPICRNAGS